MERKYSLDFTEDNEKIYRGFIDISQQLAPVCDELKESSKKLLSAVRTINPVLEFYEDDKFLDKHGIFDVEKTLALIQKIKETEPSKENNFKLDVTGFFIEKE